MARDPLDIFYGTSALWPVTPATPPVTQAVTSPAPDAGPSTVTQSVAVPPVSAPQYASDVAPAVPAPSAPAPAPLPKAPAPVSGGAAPVASGTALTHVRRRHHYDPTAPRTVQAHIDGDLYPTLARFTAPLPMAKRKIVGRDHEMRELLAALSRPELCNALLLAPAGSGKTALVQGTMVLDKDRIYLEVDLARMVSQLGPDGMAGGIKELFDEAEAYGRDEDCELVLFIDEFHQIVQQSPSAVEAIKPMLAASGTRGLRIIAATTFDEFHQYIAPNQPLVERLQRINLPPADEATTIAILKGMAKRYGVGDMVDDTVYHLIYEYTNRYQPASSQPRKSILIFDAMVGWHRFAGRPMDERLLADVLRESIGVNVDFSINAMNLRRYLDSKVISQRFATASIARHLQVCVAGLNDKSRPQICMLFAGSTGVGKTEMVKQLAHVLFDDDDPRHLIRFDMTEFANDDTLDTFRDELSSRVWDMGHAIVLFDEVEKASAAVTRLLLQVLDDGRLSDANGRTVSFLDTYIILTSNAGSEVFNTIGNYAEDDEGSGKKLEDFEQAIRRSIVQTTGANRFPPELLGRLDAIVPFQPLSRETIRKITVMKLMALATTVRERHGISMRWTDDVVRFLVDDEGETDSDQGGARRVASKLADEVTTKVAAAINARGKELKRMLVVVRGRMKWSDTSLRRSQAWADVIANPDDALYDTGDGPDKPAADNGKVQ